MWQRLAKVLKPDPHCKPASPPPPRVVLAEACIEGLTANLETERQRGHEGVAYLLGQTNGTVTLAVATVKTDAVTTPGSFSVSAPAMAKIVKAATKTGLQIAAQVHTHPARAYHSAGDIEGARIVYRGFVSIVLPDYGRRLPALNGAAVYMFTGEPDFTEVPLNRVDTVPGALR